MEQLLKRNENENNELVSNIFLGLSGLVLSIWLLAVVGIFDVYFNIISAFAITMIILLVIPVVLVRLVKLRNSVLKYVLVGDVGLMTVVGYMFFTHQMVVMFLITVLISLLYMNKKFLWFAEAVSVVSLLLAHLISTQFVAQPWMEFFSETDDIMRFNFIPRLLQLVACFFVVNVLMNRVIDYFNQYDVIINEGTGTNSELKEFERVLSKLTESEKNVFLELLRGKTNSQIAEELSYSNGTVKNYVSSIYDKLECRERSYLILNYSAVLGKYDKSHMK